MKRRTYQAFIILAVIAVICSVAITVGFLYRKHIIEEELATETVRFSRIPEDTTFSIHFFDVGEGDSAMVECDGHYMLIDGGDSSYSSFLYSYLQKNHITYLDYIVCTHAHSDHVGGLAGALNYAKVGFAYSPVTEYDSRAFRSFIKYLDAQGKSITVPSAGETFLLGSAEVTIIAPIDMRLAAENENNSSLVLRIVYGNTSFLFTGDAEEAEELSIVKSGSMIQSSLLKVGHHGSNTSSSNQFIKAVKPSIAIISVGKNNEYGHPHEVALRRLQEYCSEIYRTDINGEINCISDGRTIITYIEK